MINSFSHKGLELFFKNGTTKGINPQHSNRLRNVLAMLDAATSEQDLRVPWLKLHQLTGNYKGMLSVTVTANWRVIFKFEGENVILVDYLDYH